jgi:DUF177 domain-containing protein
VTGPAQRGPRRGPPVDEHGDPLTFALSGFLAEPAGSIRDYPIDSATIEPIEDLRVVGPVSGRVRLSRTNRGIVVSAQLTGALAGECVRCLRPVVTPVRIRIDEEVLPTIDLASGLPAEIEEGADPEAARLTDHHELELRPLVREAISLEAPVAPLCEPDCPGLCPECGARLEPGHEHDEAPVDPRLEALRSFRVDGEAESE